MQHPFLILKNRMEDKMKQSSFFYRVKKDWMRNRSLYLMIIPVLIFFILFHYKPMYGAIIAFKDYTPALGIAESPWVRSEERRVGKEC